MRRDEREIRNHIAKIKEMHISEEKENRAIEVAKKAF